MCVLSNADLNENVNKYEKPEEHSSSSSSFVTSFENRFKSQNSNSGSKLTSNGRDEMEIQKQTIQKTDVS